jgi:hypothetical protein
MTDKQYETTEATPEKTAKRNQIAALAFMLWQARGCPAGTPDEDWFRSEPTQEAETNGLRFPHRSELSKASGNGSV